MYRSEASKLTGRKRSRFGEATAFDEGLYNLGHGVYAWMVPNGSWGENNSGLVLGDGESLLLDTQWDVPCTAEMLDAMRPLTREAPIKHLVITHADGDHSWGCALAREAEVVMSAAADSESRELKPTSMTLMSGVTGALTRAGWGNVKKACHYLHGMTAPYDFKGAVAASATTTFQKRTTIEVGGRALHLIEAGPAHTRGDVIVHIPDAGVVFCGDIVFNGSTPVLWAGPLENWVSSLTKMLELDAETFVPGHGPICGREGVLKMKEYWEYIGRELRKYHEAGMSARDAACDIALGQEFAESEYARWDSPERIMTSAHVTYRHLEGRGGHLKPAEKVLILWKQGLLASDMPGAAPASMHRP
jgi:cyclase